MGMTTCKAVYLSGLVEDIEGVPIDGTPFFAHEVEAESGKVWRVTHVGSGAAIGFGWYKQDDAVCSVRTWWRELDGEVRAAIESVTADSLAAFKSWKLEDRHKLMLHRLSDLCDFTWTKFEDGGI